MTPSLSALAALLAASLVAPGALATATSTRTEDFSACLDAARQNAPGIFNAVHDAMRQWGSSLHHNGMSFFLATVPAGVQLYHGNGQEASPTVPDWLAYEIEHAENFARTGFGPPGRKPGGPEPPIAHPGGPSIGPFDDQQVLNDPEPPEEIAHGYLHVYRTVQPLHYLYIDGMGAGKTAMGTLDSQDLLLRDAQAKPQTAVDEDPVNPEAPPGPGGGGPMDERERAIELCQMVQPWGLHGMVRMEAGFEIIHCNFSDGLQQVQALRRPVSQLRDTMSLRINSLEFLRGITARYHSIGAQRTAIDMSSMVSAYFVPGINLTNPDRMRPDLPRLVSAASTDLKTVRHRLAEIIPERVAQMASPSIDWQGITDLIVGRYSERMQYMLELAEAADETSMAIIAREINFLLDVYIDYPGQDRVDDVNLDMAVYRCAHHYVRTVERHLATEADNFIHAAIISVADDICTTLLQVRESTMSSQADDTLTVAETLSSLLDRLNWASFKRCPACGLGEVCMIPMWPMGTVSQYRSPRCTNGTESEEDESYWGGFGLPRHGRRPESGKSD